MKENFSENLVFIDEYGLLGSNFYWHRHDAQGITKEEVIAAGLTSDRVQVHEHIIKPLLKVDADLHQKGFRLYIKEGYRSVTLYHLIYEKRVQRHGKEITDRLINMTDMPHASGMTVDVTLWDPEQNAEVSTRDKKDDPEALFLDFYRNKTDTQSKHYQELQDLIRNTMERNGFEIGKKREYFHFNFRKNS